MSNRVRKINALLKKELSGVILEEIDFAPRVLVSISEVETSSDLKHAKIFVSVIPKTKEKEVQGLLQENIFTLQKELNRKVRLRYTPKIHFHIDPREERAARIEEIIQAEKEN